jgi:polyhydroxyalkanoate synthesis regulator phasin
MAARKKSARKATSARSKVAPSRLESATRTAKNAARSAVHTAEGALHHLRSNLSHVDARKAIASIGRAVIAERRSALKRIDTGLTLIQERVEKERKTVSRVAEATVRRTLAALNIPSRREIATLTRKVDELSRRIGAQKQKKARR